jgi:serine/threonine-protein kinase RsbW
MTSGIQETRMSERTTSPPHTRSGVFPARPDQVREARKLISAALEGCPAADDAILCLSEMATNAILHSDSRKPGGHFTVSAETRGDRLRIEVCDQGGHWAQPRPGGMQYGHGLHIISQLTQAWGITGDSDTGWTVWAEITCP